MTLCYVVMDYIQILLGYSTDTLECWRSQEQVLYSYNSLASEKLQFVFHEVYYIETGEAAYDGS